MKKCFKCHQEKELSEFYRHKKMHDGHLNKCKECTKKDVKVNRKENVDYYRTYDRERGSRQPPEYLKEYRERFPKKYKAHSMVGYSVKMGFIEKKPCEICEEKENVCAHHDDYDKPLEVRWLCYAHHSQWHKENGEGLNPI